MSYLDRHKKKVIVVGVLVLALVVALCGILYFGVSEVNPDRKIIWGATFSQKFSEEMELDWRKTYRAMLEDLGIKHIRLVAYWDLIEPRNDEFSFEDLDEQFRLAEEHGAEVVLSVGQKVPRWPECHYPTWIEPMNMQSRNDEFLEYLETVLRRYKDQKNLTSWQIENEPFFPFGKCPVAYPRFLDDELRLTRAIDPTRPILMTDSGELGLWYFAARRGDIFGTTMYRRVYNKWFGYIDYRLSPAFFQVKERLIRILTGDEEKTYIVTELAAEPWLKKQLYETTAEEHFSKFDIDFFADTIRFARQTPFDTFYLWGAEWWWWLKERQGHPEFWDYAKTIYTEN